MVIKNIMSQVILCIMRRFSATFHIYAVFLPVNGVGNNMNMTDAARFAKRINAERTVPMHIGMFDEITADEFDCENKIIANIYEEIKL